MARRRPQVCKVDDNQKDIVKHLRALGWSVTSLAKVGFGAPDLLVGFEGINVLLEVKMPGHTLNSNEIDWHANWQGRVYEVHSTAEAVDAVLDAVGRVKELKAKFEIGQSAILDAMIQTYRKKYLPQPVKVVRFPKKKVA